MACPLQALALLLYFDHARTLVFFRVKRKGNTLDGSCEGTSFSFI